MSAVDENMIQIVKKKRAALEIKKAETPAVKQAAPIKTEVLKKGTAKGRSRKSRNCQRKSFLKKEPQVSAEPKTQPAKSDRAVYKANNRTTDRLPGKRISRNREKMRDIQDLSEMTKQETTTDKIMREEDLIIVSV